MAFSATTMMLIGQYGPPTYVAIGAVAILMFILAYRCYISYRKRAAVTVNCWFCNTNHKVPYLQRNSWDCPSCEQYNGFTADGDYNKVIPAVCEDRKMYNLQSAQRYCEKTNGLCVECNRNQLLKIKQLASFVPNSEANFDTEVEQYQKHLESVYKLCPSCAAVVKRHLNQQNSKLSMMLAAAQRKAAGLLSPKSVSSTKAERRKRRRRWIKKDFAANFCHFTGFFLSLCLWVVALHQLQEDSHNEIIGLTYMLPDRLIQLLPQLSHSAGALVVVALFLEILAGWRNRRSRFPITLDLLTGSVLLGATAMFLDVLAENLCSSREDRHIWQLCISTLVCFVVWCSAFVPRSKIHRNRIRLKTVRSRADMSVYSSICSTCSSPSPLPSLNNSCSNSTAGSGRDSPMDTCDVVTTHSALETLQIGPQIKLRNPAAIGSGNLRKPFSQPDFIRYSQSPSVVSSVSSFRSSSLSQPAHKPIIGPARISVSNYVPTGTFAMAPVAQPGWNSGFQRRSTFTFGQKSAFSSDSFSRGGSQDDDSRSVISNFSSVSGRMSPEKRSSPQPVANTQRLSSSESWWKLGIAAAVLVSLMTNAVVVYFVATK